MKAATIVKLFSLVLVGLMAGMLSLQAETGTGRAAICAGTGLVYYFGWVSCALVINLEKIARKR